MKSLSNPFRLSGNDAFVSASIGITVYPTDGDSNETLLRKSDTAMYKAKDAGSNNYQFFTQQMDEEANQRRELESALYLAVEKNQFSLEYQPVVQVNNNQIVGVEALIRWNHETLGEIDPKKFIPLAEEIGLILPISEWMLKEACTNAVLWLDHCGDSFIVSVNFSSRLFQKCNVPELVERVLKQTGLAGKHLMLEINESLIIGGNTQTLHQLEKVRDIDVDLAVDGFGTGYSSLSYLKKYPIDTLKIDQSFIQDINIDKDDDELIKGILSMAKSLNLQVVAEGVTSSNQVNFLKMNNCDYIQGQFYCEALAADQMCKFIIEYQEQENLSLDYG